jgi:hypothetical protein
VPDHGAVELAAVVVVVVDAELDAWSQPVVPCDAEGAGELAAVVVAGAAFEPTALPKAVGTAHTTSARTATATTTTRSFFDIGPSFEL